MNTRVKKQKEYLEISLDGKVDYEAQEPMKEALDDLLEECAQDATPRTIIFNFERLQFVGSCGISQFINTLKDFNTRIASKPKYTGVSSEFQKVIRAFDDERIFEFWDSDLPQKSYRNRFDN